MLDLLKKSKGYLRVRVNGFSPERFMNLCANNDILLWKIQKVSEGYEMNISLSNFYRLKPIVRKTRTRVVVLQRYGLPFFMPVLQRKKVFVSCAVLVCFLWYCSTYFIWTITFEGNRKISSNQLQKYLDENGIHVGMLRKTLDINDLEKSIRNEFTEITWISARMDGTSLVFTIKENDAPIISGEEASTLAEGTDLISQYDGKIESIVVRKGIPCVREGDMVSGGDLLIDGRIPIYNEDGTVREYLYENSDADILIEHKRPITIHLPGTYCKKEYTGRIKKQRFMQFGDKCIWQQPLGDNFLVYDRLMKKQTTELFQKLRFPLYSGTYCYREYQNKEYRYDREEAEAVLQKKFNMILQTLEEKGVQIIEKDVKIDMCNNGWTMYGEMLVHEPAGKRVATDRGEPDNHE